VQQLTPPVLVARDVSVSLGRLPILRGIDLNVSVGEAVALMGGNGSGKSTLVRALLGLLPHQRGSVELFGTPLRSYRDWFRVGYVPQRSTSALSAAKVREVVASGLLARRRPFVPLRRAERQAVRATLAAVGLSDRAGSQMNRLSGGQQQRVLIARALVGQPELLVLDEPTAGVDVEHQQVLGQLLGERLRARVAVLVVLHEVGALGPLIDRAVVLHQGRVVQEGPVGPLPGPPRQPHRHGREEPPPRRWLLEGIGER
jgi:zinc transport system ATP-binding protein